MAPRMAVATSLEHLPEAISIDSKSIFDSKVTKKPQSSYHEACEIEGKKTSSGASKPVKLDDDKNIWHEDEIKAEVLLENIVTDRKRPEYDIIYSQKVRPEYDIIYS